MADSLPSTKPYLVRALYEWCSDHGFTPYLQAQVDERTRVPRQHVKKGEITLNVSADATGSLQISNDFVEFMARFSGVAEKISIPMSQVTAIYSRENGVGMMFEVEDKVSAEESPAAGQQGSSPSLNLAAEASPPPSGPLSGEAASPAGGTGKPAGSARQHLKRIK